MKSVADAIRALLEGTAGSPWIGSLLGTLAAGLVALALAAAIERALAKRRQVAPGPLFLLSAVVLAALHTALAAAAAIRGQRAEEWLVEWLAGEVGAAPAVLAAQLAPVAVPLVLGATFAAYLVVTLALAWAFGVLSGDDSGGIARELEEELGTAWGPAWFRLVGYLHPEGPEERFVLWAKPIAQGLALSLLVAMPLAVTGAMPAGALAGGLVLADAMRRLVSRPTAHRHEPAKEEPEAAGAPAAPRDPDQLVRALQVDRRGPLLRIGGGGVLHGFPEHLAEATRVKEESPIIAGALDALGIDGFYVHQEAATEALLAGRDVLMEAPPLSGRRTLGDVLALRSVLLDGGTVIYLSPTQEECARRAEAFSRVAQRSNWRWAILGRDLATDGRTGLDPRVRQPQIVFATPDELDAELCRLHTDWDDFLARLALVVAIDLDRYLGARGANLRHAWGRLSRLVELAGGEPHVLTTIAPWGPDVQGFAERLVGRPLTVIGPESDSRGSPSQLVLIGGPTAEMPVHPSVLARGVSIACGYAAELWGWDDRLTEFEQEQQVNKVLLAFGKAVVSVADRTHLRFDGASGIVVRLGADAAMIPFFTRHVGRIAMGVASYKAEDVARRKATVDDDAPAAPFQGFSDEAAQGAVAEADRRAPDGAPLETAPAAAAPDGSTPAAPALDPAAASQALAAAVAAQLAQQPELLPSVWVPDDDPFSRHLAADPDLVHPDSLHRMLRLGARLVAGEGGGVVEARHLVRAAHEAPIERREAIRRYSPAAVEALLHPAEGDPLLAIDARWDLDDEGRPTLRERLVSTGGRLEAGSMAVTSGQRGRLLNRAGGELVLETDADRLLVTAYPGRVLCRGGRRYRVALPHEQDRLAERVAWAEPERRRTATERMRQVALVYDGVGHAVRLGGAREVLLGEFAVALRETVLGLRTAQTSRGDDQVLFDAPVEAAYDTRAAVVDIPGASPEAMAGLERVVRVTLPAFVRHEEDDLDVVALAAEDPAGGTGRVARLAFVDRHVGAAGFARAVGADVVRHALFWAQRIVDACGADERCRRDDGCPRCILGAPSRAAPGTAAPSRAATAALLEAVLGPGELRRDAKRAAGDRSP